MGGSGPRARRDETAVVTLTKAMIRAVPGALTNRSISKTAPKFVFVLIFTRGRASGVISYSAD